METLILAIVLIWGVIPYAAEGETVFTKEREGMHLGSPSVPPIPDDWQGHVIWDSHADDPRAPENRHPRTEKLTCPER